MAKGNKGAPGIDGVTFDDIERHGAEEFLEQIRSELVSGIVPTHAQPEESAGCPLCCGCLYDIEAARGTEGKGQLPGTGLVMSRWYDSMLCATASSLTPWVLGRRPVVVRSTCNWRSAFRGAGWQEVTSLAGTRLPPERKLAQQLAVSRSTVLAVYRVRGRRTS